MTGPLLPGATIGIFGGGQLGRMIAMAARGMGYRILVLDPDPGCPARFIVDGCIEAGWGRLARGGDAGARVRCGDARDRADWRGVDGFCGDVFAPCDRVARCWP